MSFPRSHFFALSKKGPVPFYLYPVPFVHGRFLVFLHPCAVSTPFLPLYVPYFRCFFLDGLDGGQRHGLCKRPIPIHASPTGLAVLPPWFFPPQGFCVPPFFPLFSFFLRSERFFPNSFSRNFSRVKYLNLGIIFFLTSSLCRPPAVRPRQGSDVSSPASCGKRLPPRVEVNFMSFFWSRFPFFSSPPPF